MISQKYDAGVKKVTCQHFLNTISTVRTLVGNIDLFEWASPCMFYMSQFIMIVI